MWMQVFWLFKLYRRFQSHFRQWYSIEAAMAPTLINPEIASVGLGHRDVVRLPSVDQLL